VGGGVSQAGGRSYEQGRLVWNAIFERHPRLNVQPRSVDDVVGAVRLAHEEQLVVSVRGGGRSVAGFSTCNDGIVIDLSQMDGVTIDPVRRRATAQGGALIERQGRSGYYLDGRLRPIPSIRTR